MRGSLTFRARVFAIVAASTSALAVPSLYGQGAQSNQQAPAFEAASIKPNRSGEQRSGFSTPANRFIGTNVALHELIAWAYGDPGPPPEFRDDFQMSGGPAWSTT